MRKKLVVLTILVSFVFLLSSCQKIDLSKEDEKLVVAYAADCVLKFDFDYPNKLLNYETTTADNDTTSPTDKQTETNNSEKNTTKKDDSSSNNSEAGDTYVNLDDILNKAGLYFTVTGYKTVKTYQVEGSSNSNIMSATDHKNLLVVEINVKNTISNDITYNALKEKLAFIGIINSKTRTNAQIWANDTTLNVFNGVINANSNKKLVLVYQINDDISVDSFELAVSKGDNSGLVKIK